MKKILFIICLCIFLTACSTVSDPAKETLLVATGANYLPFAFLNSETGEIDGFDIELMRAIAEEANMEIKFEAISWDGFIAAMEKGRFDLGIYGVTITEERKRNIDFSSPYYASGLIFMVRADNHQIRSIDDFHGKNIGTVTHTTSEAYLRKHYPDAHISPFLGSPEMYMELRSGRIDGVLYDLPSINYYISTQGEGQFKTVGEVLQGEDYGITFPKGSPLVEKINGALAEVIKKGIYDDIYEKWFNQRPFARL